MGGGGGRGGFRERVGGVLVVVVVLRACFQFWVASDVLLFCSVVMYEYAWHPL
jgi:hypothetical protein